MTEDRSNPSPEQGEGADGLDPLDAEAAELFADAASAPQGDGGASGSASADAQASDAHSTGGADDRVSALESQVAELQEELKRSQAEYVNSRRRIEAGALVSTEAAVARVVTSLIGVLDDVELGRQHGDIAEGTPFHSIAQKLENALSAHGMERYGEAGEAFDPNLHEALMHEDSDEVEVNTIRTVLQPGYRMKDRILRPARVATYGPQ